MCGSMSMCIIDRTSQPSIQFVLPSSVSVIKKLYPPTALEAGSVTARIDRLSAGWKLVVDGQVTQCPGSYTQCHH